MRNFVRDERKRKKLKQEELAAILRVSRQTINAIEGNRYLPSLTLALRLSMFFNMTVNELFIFEKHELEEHKF
ncbi:MAG: helix-turn-helix transcriptional regulator [Bacteroidales bacterium]|jgi:putative transcriptional regulator|nr:helix-turn-helix transcriptional regulator [Bacteroidales bacterium]